MMSPGVVFFLANSSFPLPVGAVKKKDDDSLATFYKSFICSEPLDVFGSFYRFLLLKALLNGHVKIRTSMHLI